MIDNIQGKLGSDGMYYHYSDICTLLKKRDIENQFSEQEKRKLIEGFIIEYQCASMKWRNIDTDEEEPRGITNEMINSYVRKYNKQK